MDLTNHQGEHNQEEEKDKIKIKSTLELNMLGMHMFPELSNM